MTGEIIPVLHNVSSVQRVVDAARITYSLGYTTLVVTKAYGGAAQSGIAEAMRISLRENKRFIVLPDLKDAIELLEPEKIYLVSFDYAEKRIPTQPIEFNGRILIVFSGSDPDFSASELKKGEPIYVDGVGRRIGSTGELAIILYLLSGERGEEKDLV